MARKVAALKKAGLTEAVHAGLSHELVGGRAKPSLVDVGVKFVRALRAKGRPELGQPVNKAFRDSLYEDSGG